MHSLIINYLLIWKPLGYFLVFFGMFFEGDILLYTASFVTFQGLVNFHMMLLTTLMGVILGDLTWFWIGQRYKNSKILTNHWINRLAKPFDQQLQQRTFRTILVSKFIYGLHHAILIRAGALNLPKKYFFKIDLISNAIWISIIGLLGYFSSASFSLIKNYLYYAEVAIFAGMIFFFIFWHYISHLVKKCLLLPSKK